MKSLYSILFFLALPSLGFTQPQFQSDVISTDDGDLEMVFLGHASLLFKWQDEVIYIDPSSREADFYKLPKATKVFVTHHHGDHCDPGALKAITVDDTKSFMSALAHEQWSQGMVLYPDQAELIDGIKIEVLPAYNLVHKRDDGTPFHVKGECNSYLLTIGGKRIFIGGDTENTPEMKSLKNVDIAFLPMNLPYTMTPEMVADAAKGFKPAILYPYHYGNTDLSRIEELMADTPEVELRIRKF